MGKYFQNSGLAALAAALVVTALPAAAQDNGEGTDFRAAQRAMAQQQRAERQQQRSEQRAQQSQPVEQRTAPAERRTQQYEQRAQQSAQPQPGTDFRGMQREMLAQQRAQEDRRDGRNQQWGRNGTYSDQDRNRTYRDGRRDNDGWQGNDRRDGSRWSDNDRYDTNRYDRRQWDRRWRDNSRYDWQRYRSRNRVVFDIGTYYAPYRNYSYRRFGVGSTLNSLFFGRNYWINDPWQYRLPEVYGPYRWVRYYDDVLLVDVYSGQVVDVIYDFFW